MARGRGDRWPRGPVHRCDRGDGVDVAGVARGAGDVRDLVAKGVRVEVVANEHMSIVCRTVMRLAGAQHVALVQREQAPQALHNAIAAAAVKPLASH